MRRSEAENFDRYPYDFFALARVRYLIQLKRMRDTYTYDNKKFIVCTQYNLIETNAPRVLHFDTDCR